MTTRYQCTAPLSGHHRDLPRGLVLLGIGLLLGLLGALAASAFKG